MKIQQGYAQMQTVTPQTIQSRQLLLLPAVSLEAFLSKIVLDNPYLEMQYDAEVHPVMYGNPPLSTVSPEEDWDTSRPAGDDTLDFKDEIFRIESISLRDALCFQAGLHKLSALERTVITRIIDAIDDTGYLGEALTSIADSAGCSQQVAEAMLHLVQTFSPEGVGAQTLEECLLLQLAPGIRDYSLICRIIKEDLETLAHHRYDLLRKKHRVEMPRLLYACNAIRALNPKPGAAYCAERATPYIYPDAAVHLAGGRLELTISGKPDSLVRFDRDYMHDVEDKEAVRFLRAKKSEATILISSLKLRYNTMQKLLEFIVREQRDFFLAGPAHLRPITMKDAAAAIEMHPSTVSRCVSGKYLATPRGLYPLRFFFPSAAGGDELSVETVRQIIIELIKSEDRANPVSDEEIMTKLMVSGIKISRRTVSKYRKQLGYAGQRERKHHM